MIGLAKTILHIKQAILKTVKAMVGNR
jgi:hypothetical protein